MINVEYTGGEIKVTTGLVSILYNLPLRLVISNHVTNVEVWSCEMSDDSWASFPNNEMNDVNIYDKNGLIYSRPWDVMYDGDFLYKTLYMYCKSIDRYNMKPQGLAVGTHDGEFGEWVPCVLDYITDAYLVEASKPQFEKLSKNYEKYTNVKLINELVTLDGKPTEFYEGGRGYTNSVVERVIKSWEKEKIEKNLKNSIKIMDLIKSTPNGRIDWLHTDVEGYDDSLIMSIDKEYLPNLIIFENNNFEYDKRIGINNYLINLNYVISEFSVSTIALKVKS
jgi:hypothetical protein